MWASSSPAWEPTATKGFGAPDRTTPRDATIDEMVALGRVLVRLELPPDFCEFTWAEHRVRGPIAPEAADRLEEAARSRGADPSQWRLSYHAVPLSKVLCIEWSTDGIHWLYGGKPKGDGLSLVESLVGRLRN